MSKYKNYEIIKLSKIISKSHFKNSDYEFVNKLFHILDILCSLLNNISNYNKRLNDLNFNNNLATINRISINSNGLNKFKFVIEFKQDNLNSSLKEKFVLTCLDLMNKYYKTSLNIKKLEIYFIDVKNNSNKNISFDIEIFLN